MQLMAVEKTVECWSNIFKRRLLHLGLFSEVMREGLFQQITLSLQ